MLIIERQQRILEYLRANASASLESLAFMLGVSVSTVRRDVDALADTGEVTRTHGGVFLDPPPHQPDTPAGPNALPAGQTAPLAERMTHRVDAKRAIGKAAAALVEPDMTVLMDAGSTVVFAAQQITARPLQIVTNSLIIANLYADDDDVELIVIGGSLYPRSSALVGPFAVDCIDQLHADLLLFSLAGLHDADDGSAPAAYNINLDMAQTERAMIRQAARSVMLMDSHKLGRKSLVRVCDLAPIDHVITEHADPHWREALADRLILAQ